MLVRSLSLLTLCCIHVTIGIAQPPREDSAHSQGTRQTGAPVAVVALDAQFARAEQLLREGHGKAGRALVDSLLSRTQPGTMAHAQALYWRAALASDAAEAERGYRRVFVEYPASRWAGEALLNLAQLEMARGEQDRALTHLLRFEREHPQHPNRARAAFWIARLQFEKKNIPRACATLATARSAASPDDIELRQQIDRQVHRCIGVDTTPARVAAGGGSMPSDTFSRGVKVPANAVTTATTMTDRPSPSVSTPVGSVQRRYSVQVAAFDTREGAEALTERLTARGLSARVTTVTRPFRVRIGPYATRREAILAQRELRDKGIDGFIAEDEP